MRWPLVSRRAFDVVTDALVVERRRTDRLSELVATMRQQGFTAAKPASVREAKDEEAEGLAAAESRLIQRRDDTTFLRRATADIKRRVPGISDAKALEEARRLRAAVTDQEDSPV